MTRDESLHFRNVDPTVKRAFLRAPEKIRLDARVRLCQWTNRPLLGRHGISPWWSFVESTRLPSGTMAEGFRVSDERAGPLGRTYRDYTRARAAFSGEFQNPMTDLLVICLEEPVGGFAGQAAGQPEFAKKHVGLQHAFLSGGEWQVWIPRLSERRVTALPVVA